MKYFRNNTTDEVFGYDADQQDLIAKAEADPNMTNITGSWPIEPTVDPLLVKEIEVRTERDILLARCDWTQVPDAPVDQAAWASYRQQLRDIPQQSGFPNNVIWPTKPE